MTLATILVFSIFCALAAMPSVMAAPQTATQSVAATASQDQQATPPAQTPSTPSEPPPSAAPPSTSAEQSSSTTTQPTPRKRSRHKKRVAPADCAPAGAATSDSSAAGNPPTAGPSSTSKNCPPSKVIVRQGGTSDPSIQLGGSGTASHQKDTATQMLAATETNLKKIAGQQLSSNQQEMVSQIRQFMEQSKFAAGDGDLERARTLAWKAQLLSDELVKPAGK
jgi:hypothetical protein